MSYISKVEGNAPIDQDVCLEEKTLPLPSPPPTNQLFNRTADAPRDTVSRQQ